MSDIKKWLCNCGKSLSLVGLLVTVLFVGFRFLFPPDIAKTLIEYAAWPLLIGVLVLLYHTDFGQFMKEVVEFIKRSYYRHGEEDHLPAQKNAKRIGGEVQLEESPNAKTAGTEISRERTPKHSYASFCEHQLLERIQMEYGVPIYEHQSIGVSTYYFDAVMEYRGMLYGIEVRMNSEHCNWDRIFADVQKAYDGFMSGHKKRFVFMICLGSGNENDVKPLRSIAKKYDFQTVIKYY